ncbi:MAG TPA: hypothetical protein VE783_11015 [Candidatus Limnocylindrales bacterium]|nr:hypothetical protein [Candidatus Limnocylindrales bacterium]
MSKTPVVTLNRRHQNHTAPHFEQRKRNSSTIFGFALAGVLAVIAFATPVTAQETLKAAPVAVAAPELESGFHLLYELKPSEAREQFDAWQKAHPEDPLASALQAANYLLEECYKQGVLTSEFFLDDKHNNDKTPLKSDPEKRAGFFAAFGRAQQLALARLKDAPNDANALFAMTMSLGMQADYAGLIDKKQVESLGMMKDAAKYAKQLLAIDANNADAYLALGFSDYIVGSLPGHQKFFLGFKGIHGDEKQGIKELQIAATRGHYLRPFAKMLLALASLKQKKPDVARTHFTELATEFPDNPLFASELAKLGGAPSATASLQKQTR